MPSIVIPWLDNGDQYRVKALKWVLEKYRTELPNWEINVSRSFNGGVWCKGEMVRQGVKTSKSDLIVVADADVWTTGLPRAAMAVTAGISDWAIPHKMVYRLTRAGTDAVYRGASWRLQPHERPYAGRRGGGYVVATKAALLEVPMDTRFVGWGQEDESWDYALTTLLGDPFHEGADLVHLWHQKPERMDRRKGNNESWRLMKKYMKARNDPEVMRAIVGEVN